MFEGDDDVDFCDYCGEMYHNCNCDDDYDDYLYPDLEDLDYGEDEEFDYGDDDYPNEYDITGAGDQ